MRRTVAAAFGSGSACAVVQHRVLELQHVRLAEIGEDEVERELLAVGARTVQARGHRREEALDRHVPQQPGDRGVGSSGAPCCAVAKLVGAASGRRRATGPTRPDSRAGRRSRASSSRASASSGIGEDQVVEQRRDPAVVAALEGRLRLPTHLARRRPSHRRSASPASTGGSGSRFAGLRVVPAEVPLVDRLGVVAQRAVVAAVGEDGAQRLRQLDLLGDLLRCQAQVRQAQASDRGCNGRCRAASSDSRSRAALPHTGQ